MKEIFLITQATTHDGDTYFSVLEAWSTKEKAEKRCEQLNKSSRSKLVHYFVEWFDVDTEFGVLKNVDD